ncbi:MAG TPA: alpha/beta hydrolase [Bryobacteraceae bacterium]|nr:alpha/beta hydrolase [Bryobacteraceae bacterium]
MRKINSSVLCLSACLTVSFAQNPEKIVVKSSNGVDIAVYKSGAGPALLLVHGSAKDGPSEWGRVQPLLSRHFTVYVMDRRGHGSSGDGAQYSIAEEAADIASVSRALGDQVIVVAHSYGALCSLAGLPQLSRLSRLILYEPPLFIGPTPPAKAELFTAYEQALERKDFDEAKVIGMRIAGMPESVIAGLRASPTWAPSERIDINTREGRTVNTFRLGREELSAFKVRTTMLLGTRTQGYLREGAAFVCNSLAACEMVALEGQGHVAHKAAPDLFAESILKGAGRMNSK